MHSLTVPSVLKKSMLNARNSAGSKGPSKDTNTPDGGAHSIPNFQYYYLEQIYFLYTHLNHKLVGLQFHWMGRINVK